MNTSLLPVPFEQALISSKFARELRRSAQRAIIADVQRNMGVPLKGAKVVVSRGTLRVAFDKGATGVRLMKDRTGRELPTLVNASGKTSANARVVGRTTRVAGASVSAAIAVIEVAHIISDADNTKRLRKVEVGVDRLLRAHEAELKAKLQAIYSHAREMLSRGADALSDHERHELQRYCRELFEIRARWLDDLKFQLENLEPTEPGFVRRLVRVGKEKAHARVRRQRAAEAEGTLEILQLINFSLMLQMVLSAASGRTTEFRHITLPDEAQRLSSFCEFAKRRADEIAGADAPELKRFLQAIAGTVDVWHAALPPRRSRTLQDRASRGEL